MKTTVTRRIPLLTRQPSARTEPAGRFKLGHHQRRAAFGCWAASTSVADREAVKGWKRKAPLDAAASSKFVAGLVALVRLWAPVTPPGTILTVPPQGASAPGSYAAELLAKLTADTLGLPFVPMLERTDLKGLHGPWHSLGQRSYLATVPNPAAPVVLVLDDLATSGTTMRLSLEALHARGVCAFGFAFSGV
jgi:hypothetical protein